jgi:hypothetical protein
MAFARAPTRCQIAAVFASENNDKCEGTLAMQGQMPSPRRVAHCVMAQTITYCAGATGSVGMTGEVDSGSMHVVQL